MRVIHAPGEMAANAEYLLVGDSDRTRFLRRILEAVRPDTRCLGFADGIGAPTAASLLLAEPDWPVALAELRRAGWPEASLLVMPCPEGDPWSYWSLAEKFLGEVDFLADLGERHPAFFKTGSDKLSDPEWKRHYCCYCEGLVRRNLPYIRDVLGRLADRKSRELYGMVLGASPYALWSHYVKAAFRGLQYFDHVRLGPGDVVIDGGVFYGSEIPFYLAHLEGEGRVYCVDPFGFDHLSDYARANMAHFPGLAQEERLAFGPKTGEVSLPVLGDGQVLGRAVDTAVEGFRTERFPSTTLDDFVAGRHLEKIDLIKLDLEGAEEHILPGLIDVAREFRPQLAVSIYHTKQHLWQIPLIIMSKLADYDYYIDVYSCECYETIFYAIPRERAGR